MLAATFEYDQKVFTSEILAILQVWNDTQDNAVLARGLYDIGQTAFRHGIPLPELVRTVHRWAEANGQLATQAADPVLTMPTVKLVTHFLTRGYEDAVR